MPYRDAAISDRGWWSGQARCADGGVGGSEVSGEGLAVRMEGDGCRFCFSRVLQLLLFFGMLRGMAMAISNLPLLILAFPLARFSSDSHGISPYILPLDN